MDGQESVLYSDPFSNAVPVIDPFSGDALKNDLFKGNKKLYLTKFYSWSTCELICFAIG